MAKCLFVWRAHDHESLAIEYLSAVLKKAGHKTDLILISDHEEKESMHKRLNERINSFNPDFVCFSVMTDDYILSCELSLLIKKIRDIPIIFGGVHITSCPEEVINNDFVDYIILGEGDEAIVELINNPKRTNIQNVWLKKDNQIIKNKLRPLVKDLDSLPYPDKDLFFKEAPYLKGEVYYCMSGRGCPFGCSYCFNNYLRKLYDRDEWLRKRSVKNLIEELKIGKERFGYHLVHFGDDCFTYDKEWLREFFKEYKKEINVPFKMLAHPNFMNKEIISILKKGGCLKAQMGAQTPLENIRRKICKRNESNDLIAGVVAELKRQGIFVQLDHLYGLPSQETEDLKKGIEFYIDLKPDVISPYWLQYYPNCDITNLALDTGEIDRDYFEATLKGKVGYSRVVQDLKKDKDIAAISRFFWWIPVLPRPVSKYLLRTGLYSKFFKSDIFNKIPFFIRHLRNLELIRVSYKSIIRKNKLKNHYLELNSRYN